MTKMIYKLSIITFLLLVLVSCSSCTKKDQVAGSVCSDSSCPLPPPSSSTVVPGQVYKDVDWEVTIPEEWVAQSSVDSEPNIKLFAINADKHSAIVLAKEPTKATLNAYALTIIRRFKDIDAVVLSVSQVEINGINYILIESKKNSVKGWIWATTKNNFGYSLTCGGIENDSWNHDACFSIANTLKVK